MSRGNFIQLCMAGIAVLGVAGAPVMAGAFGDATPWGALFPFGQVLLGLASIVAWNWQCRREPPGGS